MFRDVKLFRLNDNHEQCIFYNYKSGIYIWIASDLTLALFCYRSFIIRVSVAYIESWVLRNKSLLSSRNNSRKTSRSIQSTSCKRVYLIVSVQLMLIYTPGETHYIPTSRVDRFAKRWPQNCQARWRRLARQWNYTFALPTNTHSGKCQVTAVVMVFSVSKSYFVKLFQFSDSA